MYKNLKLMKIKSLHKYRSAILINKLMKESETLNIHNTLKEYCTPMTGADPGYFRVLEHPFPGMGPISYDYGLI